MISQNLVDVLQDDDLSLGLSLTFVDKFFSEGDSDMGPWRDITHWVVRSNMAEIAKHCESPLEKIFFRSFQLSFLKNCPSCLRVMPPNKGDAEEATKEHVESSRKAFVEQRVNRAPGSLFHTEFILGFHHVFHLALQPTFKTLYGAQKTVRPDALVWIPSNPACRVIVECDGFEWHRHQDAFASDRKRDRAFAGNGYSVRRYSGREVFSDAVTAGYDLFDYLTDHFEYDQPLREKWEKEVLISA